MNHPSHTPVLAHEVVDLLDPQPGQTVVDATLGLGGHAELILQRLGKTGKLIGIDKDAKAIQIAGKNLSRFKDQLVLVHGDHRNISQLVKGAGARLVAGIFFDLGVSSYQLDEASRGFSFNKQAKLDMRMDQSSKLTAEMVVNQYSLDELIEIFQEYGEEPKAEAIARRIVTARKKAPITTTEELVAVVGGYLGSKIHPATRVFQAIRIEVNGELKDLEHTLGQAFDLLQPGGRLAVISFHSLEDRIVKNYFKLLKTGGSAMLVTKKAVTPSWNEKKSNRRARSAKLRVIEKLS